MNFKMIKKVTMKDVAEEVGVSITTVHRALNEKKEISDVTSLAIRQVAEKLGYWGGKGGLSDTKRSVQYKTAVIALALPQ